MTLLRESHHGDFSLYFLAHLSPEEAGQADSENFVSRRFGPVIELTHNHGTENDADFRLVHYRRILLWAAVYY